MKDVNSDDQGAVFWPSARVIVGIITGGDFTSAKSSRGAHAPFSCGVLLLSRKAMRSSRLGTPYRLAAPVRDPGELNKRSLHKPLVEEGYLPRRPARRALPPSSYRSPDRQPGEHMEQTIAFSAPHRRG